MAGGSRAPADEALVVDMHAHNFCMEQYLVNDYVAGKSGTITETRVDQLYAMNSAGVAQSVIMGNTDYDGNAGPFATSQELNEASLTAAAAHPDYFLPFYHVMPEEFTTKYTADAMAADILGGGYFGVGELYIHGHGYNISPIGAELGFMLQVASVFALPVSVHWEIGFTDLIADPKYGFIPSTDPRLNWEQLERLLNNFPSATSLEYHWSYQDGAMDYTVTGSWEFGVWTPANAKNAPLKLILCHCGAGPANAAADFDFDDAPFLFHDYKERIRTLLEEHENVWFDLAGLQLGDPSSTKTNFRLFDPSSGTITLLGQFLLNMIYEYPTRFLLGTDVDNGYADDQTDGSGNITRWGVSTYGDSISMYLEYLEFFTSDGNALPDETKELVMWGNAATVMDVVL